MTALIAIAGVGFMLCALFLIISSMPSDLRGEVFGYGPLLEHWRNRKTNKH